LSNSQIFWNVTPWTLLYISGFVQYLHIQDQAEHTAYHARRHVSSVISYSTLCRELLKKKWFLSCIVLTLQGLLLSGVETQIFMPFMRVPKVSIHTLFEMIDISAYWREADTLWLTAKKGANNRTLNIEDLVLIF